MTTDEHAHEDPQAAAPPHDPPAPRRSWEGPLLIVLIACTGVGGFYLARSGWLTGRSRANRTTAVQQTPREPPAPGLPKTPVAAEPVVAADAPLPQTPAGQFKEADQIMARLLERLPDNPDALEMAARLQALLGNSSAAITLWKRALQLNPNYAYAHLGLASLAARNSDYEEAASRYRKVLALDPRSSDTYVELADALMRQGQLEEALALLGKHLEMPPASVRGMILQGQAYLQNKQPAKAKQSFTQAAASAPDRADAHEGLGTACAQLNEAEQSRQHVAKCRQLRDAQKTPTGDPLTDLKLARQSAAKIYTDVGTIYRATGNAEDADQLWRRAAALDAKNVECRGQLVVLYQQMKRFDEALVICEQLTRIEPGNRLFWLNLGMMNIALSRLEAGEKAFVKTVEVAPKSYEGHAALVQLYLRTNKKLAEARTHADTAVQLAPSAANYYLLSVACEKNGDLASARSAIGRAVELDPKNPQYQRIRQSLQPKK